MHVNGKPHPHRPDLTLHDLLRELDIAPRHVAVAVNDDFYPSSRVPDRPLLPEDTIEIVRVIGGG